VYGREGASRNTATIAVSRERRAGPALAISCRQDNVKFPIGVGGLWPHSAVTGRLSDLSRCVPGWANFIKILRKNILSLIGQRIAFTFTLRTAESYKH
jgi:hypothetical protein